MEPAALLLACVGGDGAAVERAARLHGDAGWPPIVAHATRLGVAPLLYAALRTAKGVRVPPAIMRQLADAYYGAGALNAHRFTELDRLLSACAAAHIQVIALKGAALVPSTYGDVALRPMRDLDLLVRSVDLDAADTLLRHIGYWPDESPEAAEWYGGDAHHHLAPYTSPDGRVVVELHRHIVPRPASIGIPIEDLWRRARPLAGRRALALSLEDGLLHLCLHASLGHRFALGLLPMCDIARTIEGAGPALAWEELARRAHGWGVAKYVYVSLHVARELLHAAVPDRVLDDLRPPAFDSNVLGWASAAVFGDDPAVPARCGKVARLRAARLRDKGALVLRSAVPARNAIARMYGTDRSSTRIYFWYPVRWWHLLRGYGPLAGHMLRRDDPTLTLATRRQTERIALDNWLASAR